MTQETLLLQGSAGYCPNCCKRCLNELEEWSKKLPPDVRTGVIWRISAGQYRRFFTEGNEGNEGKGGKAKPTASIFGTPIKTVSCPGDCYRLVTLPALRN